MDIISKFWNSNNLLYQIKQHNIPECIRILTNNLDDAGPALRYVSEYGHSDLLQLLLDHNSDPNSPNENGMVPLHLTAPMSYYECVDLMHQETDVNYADHHMRTLQCLSILLKYGAQINIQNGNGYTPLYYSTLNRNTDKAFLLLEHGADPNISTILHLTLHHPHLDLALWSALVPSRTDFVRLLLKYGARPNIRDQDGCSALHCGMYSDLETVKLLLAHGADPNLQDHNGETVLHYGCRMGMLDKCQLLLAHGADVNLRNNRGQIALELAVHHSYDEISHLLIMNRSNLHLRKVRSKAPIMAFIEIKQMERICEGIQRLRLLRLHYVVVKLWKDYWYEQPDDKGYNRHSKYMLKDAIQNGWVSMD